MATRVREEMTDDDDAADRVRQASLALDPQPPHPGAGVAAQSWGLALVDAREAARTLGSAHPRRPAEAKRDGDDPRQRHRERRALAAAGEHEHGRDGRECPEQRPLERVEAEHAPGRFVRARPRPPERPEVDGEPPGGRAEDVRAEPDADDARDRPERQARASVHPGDLAVAEDVADVGADEAGKADRKPEPFGLAKRLEQLVEVGGLADERDRADGEEECDADACERLAFVEAEDLVAPAHARALARLGPKRSWQSPTRARRRARRRGARAAAP